jgi:hypothetical protein
MISSRDKGVAQDLTKTIRSRVRGKGQEASRMISNKAKVKVKGREASRTIHSRAKVAAVLVVNRMIRSRVRSVAQDLNKMINKVKSDRQLKTIHRDLVKGDKQPKTIHRDLIERALASRTTNTVKTDRQPKKIHRGLVELVSSKTISNKVKVVVLEISRAISKALVERVQVSRAISRVRVKDMALVASTMSKRHNQAAVQAGREASRAMCRALAKNSLIMHAAGSSTMQRYPYKTGCAASTRRRRNLHKPLANARSVNQRFRAGGKRHSVTVLAPTVDPIADQELLDDLAKREPQIKEVAKKLGKQLKSIRGDIEQRQSHLKEGQIDRRRFVAAVKGASDVYSNTQQSTETQFASSLVIDLSGSMYREVSSGSLYDATRILGETFDDLDMRYEVRGFGSSELVFKNIGDSTFAPERAAILAKSTFGGTLMADSAGLATNALRACDEKNRFMTILSDGDANDHELSVQRLKEARESGVLTFGIYLSSDPVGGGTRDKLNELYGGEGNWTQIWSVRELPNTVGKRLATLFKRMKK